MRVLLSLLAAAAAHAAAPVAWGAGRAPSRLAMAPPTTNHNLGLYPANRLCQRGPMMRLH